MSALFIHLHTPVMIFTVIRGDSGVGHLATVITSSTIFLHLQYCIYHTNAHSAAAQFSRALRADLVNA